MIWQFHHQFKDGHTEMKSQSKDFPEATPEVAAEHRAWLRQQIKDFPTPDKAQNMICNEKSEFFVWTTTKEEIERLRDENATKPKESGPTMEGTRKRKGSGSLRMERKQ